MSSAAIIGSVTFGEVAWNFALSVVGGLAVGWVVAWVAGWVYRRVNDSAITTGMSLLIPFAAYLPAEEIHASGVVAVVIAGLLLAHRAPEQQSPTERMAHGTVWRSLQMILENTVFLLIGLQTHAIINSLADSGLGWGTIVTAVCAVLLTVFLARPLWILSYRFVIPKRASRNPLPFRDAIVASYAGMRGVVTLAAAYVLPEETPHRSVLVFTAMVVTAGTLLIQGSTLPRLARVLGVRGPMRREDALQEASGLAGVHPRRP